MCQMGCKLQFDKPHPDHSAKKRWPKPTEGAPTSRSQGGFVATGAEAQPPGLLSRTPLGPGLRCPPPGPAGKGRPGTGSLAPRSQASTGFLQERMHSSHKHTMRAYYVPGLCGHRTLIKTSRMKREVLEVLSPGAARRTRAVLVPAASRPHVLPLLSLKRRFQNQPRSLSQ